MSRGRTRNDNCPCGSDKKFKSCHGRERAGRSAAPILTVSVLLLGLVLLVVLVPAPSSGGEGVVPGPKTTNYRTIPGLDLDGLDSEEQLRFVDHLNHTDCICDCNMTVAECRNIDPGCDHSEEMSQKFLAQMLKTRVESPISSH